MKQTAGTSDLDHAQGASGPRLVGWLRRGAIAVALTGLFLLVPSIQGFDLAAGEDQGLVSAPLSTVDQLAATESQRLVAQR
jgi:hypothetical protein